MAQEIEMLSPTEDSIMVPFRSRATVDEKREDIEYFFRITITWKEDVRLEDQANYATMLSLKGKEKERMKARKFILALYEQGPDYKDQMVPIEMEMYSFTSSLPVLRHIVRESGAVVYVTFYGFAQDSLAHVYGTEMAVILAVSLFEHLSSQYERGKNALTLSPRSSAAASSSSSSILAAFVEANQRNMKWNAEEVRNADLPQKVEDLLVRWLVEDLSDMEFKVTNSSPDRPPLTISPVTRITTALSSASFLGVDSLDDADSFGFAGGDASTSGLMTNGAASQNDTIIIDDDEELDLVVMERTAQRRVSIIPRTSGEYFNSVGDQTSNLPPEYLDSLANDQASGDIQAQKLESYRRMNILQEHNGVGSFVSTHPPPHPLVASSHHSPPNRAFADNHGHSPRPPSSKKLRGLMDQVPVNKNTGASKMDPVSNNSTKFKEDLAFPSSSNVVEIASPSPGITNRKVKLKKNCSSEEINNDNWMVGLTDEQIATILESEENLENLENYSNYAKHLKRQNNARTEPTPTARLPPPPPHRLMASNCEPTPTMIIQTPIPPLASSSSSSTMIASSSSTMIASSSSSTMIASSSPSSMVELPDVSLRRIVIDGSNVAMAHGRKKRFSCRGILIAVNYFLGRGHERSSIKVYIPQWRQNTNCDFNHIDEPNLLETDLLDFISFTPCRRVEGMKMNSYDDRIIVETAAKNRGIIVSNDKFRDLINESLSYKEAITYRLLPYNFCEDIFLPPQDPQGQGGPSLNEFLKIYRREMELHEHARPKQSTPPYQTPALPPVASATHQQQHSNQRPSQSYQQPPTQRHVQVRPPAHQNTSVPQQSQPSGFNFVPGNGNAAAAAPSTAGPFRSATVSPPRDRSQNDQTLGPDGKRSTAETEDLRVRLLEFFEGQRNLSGMIDEILQNFQKEKDLNTLASHVCAISFNNA